MSNRLILYVMKKKLTFGLLFVIFLSCCKKDDPKPLGSFSYTGEKISLISGTISKPLVQASGDVQYEIVLSKDEYTFIDLFFTSPPGDGIAPGIYLEGENWKQFEFNNISFIAIRYKLVDGVYQGSLYESEPNGSLTLSVSNNLYTITGSMNGENVDTGGNAVAFTVNFSGPLSIK